MNSDGPTREGSLGGIKSGAVSNGLALDWIYFTYLFLVSLAQSLIAFYLYKNNLDQLHQYFPFFL